MKLKLNLLALILTMANFLFAQEAVIPKPNQFTKGSGTFLLDQNCTLTFNKYNADAVRIAGFFGEYLENVYALKLKTDGTGKTIHFKILDSPDLGKEGYQLKVDENAVVISANAPNGLFYGMQTLKQLLPVESTNGKLAVPAMEIKDQPRFAWRGNMLDVGRHFFPVSFIKKYIDILAMYKINTFHWHLTDDQGWRIEIKKYPLLAETGQWRDETMLGHYNDQNYDCLGLGRF